MIWGWIIGLVGLAATFAFGKLVGWAVSRLL
jgi:hypothetical protein